MEALKQSVERFDSVPQQMKDRPRWVLWAYEKREGKATKVPKQPSGHNAKATDEGTWSTFEKVCTALDKNPDSFTGIGFVLNGDGIVGIDYDKCIINGEIAPDVLEAIEDLDSYTEWSPSGQGLHTWVFGQLPEHSNNRRGTFEAYETGRYLTVTGKHFHGSPVTIEERQEQLEVFIDKHIGAKGQSNVVPLPLIKPDTNRVAEIVESAAKGIGKKKFSRLFEQGDISGYQSASEAVQGLLHILKHYTQNPSELDAVFRSSALYKQHWSHKWDRLATKEIARVLDGFSPEEQPQGKRKKKATFDDVCQLIRDAFPEKAPKTDLFSGCLHVWHKGRYVKAAARGPYDILETIMRHSDGFYCHTGLHAAINTYAEKLTPELLIDIPVWDGRDRVSEIAAACNVTNIPKKHFEEFLKAWGSKMFLRAYDNRNHQNQCIIIKGSQGIGKDEIIEALTGGLGLYADNYTPTNDEVRKVQLLSSLLVVRVPEFERLNKTDPDILKNDITSSGTQTTRKYGRENERFEYRCSWIASANTFDFFRDHTGNRRFWVFVIDGVSERVATKAEDVAIRWKYPKSEQDKLQVLAQFKQLAADGYRVTDNAEASMRNFIQRMTPQDPVETLLFDFDSVVTEQMQSDAGLGPSFPRGDFKGFSNVWQVPNGYLNSWGIFEKLSKLHGISQRRIQQLLTARGRDWKNSRARGYLARDMRTVGMTDVTDVDDDVSQDVSHLNI
jgi:hypothetical protein